MIDANSNLDDVLRVVGAWYGVQVAVVSNSPEAAPARKSTPRKTASRGRRRAGAGAGAGSTGTTPRTRRATAARKSASRGGRRTRRPGGAAVSDIRSWAQANGHAVNSRGRIPASVLQAYRAAH